MTDTNYTEEELLRRECAKQIIQRAVDDGELVRLPGGNIIEKETLVGAGKNLTEFHRGLIRWIARFMTEYGHYDADALREAAMELREAAELLENTANSSKGEV